MTITAATGMKALESVSTISVPLIVILGVYSMVTAAADGGAWRQYLISLQDQLLYLPVWDM